MSKLGPGLLSKRIFDADSGAVLYQRNFKTGESVFLRYPQLVELPKNPNSYIKLETVLEKLTEAVAAEMDLAGKIAKKIQNGDAKELLQGQRERLAGQAEQLFARMTEVEKERIPLYEEFRCGKMSEEDYQKKRNNIRQSLRFYDGKWNDILEELTLWERRYSERNLWLCAFCGRELPKEWKLADVKRWIERVEIRGFQEISVSLTQKEEREAFPKEWLEEEER